MFTYFGAWNIRYSGKGVFFFIGIEATYGVFSSNSSSRGDNYEIARCIAKFKIFQKASSEISASVKEVFKFPTHIGGYMYNAYMLYVENVVNVA